LVFLLGAGSPAELHEVTYEPKKQKKRRFLNYFFFGFPPRGKRPGGPRRGRLRPAKKIIILYFIFYKFYILYFFLSPWSLAPRTSVGLSHESPPHLLPPNSYLLPLLLYKTPHESYFSLFLCSHLW
jgi:hypothetical protein